MGCQCKNGGAESSAIRRTDERRPPVFSRLTLTYSQAYSSLEFSRSSDVTGQTLPCLFRPRSSNCGVRRNRTSLRTPGALSRIQQPCHVTPCAGLSRLSRAPFVLLGFSPTLRSLPSRGNVCCCCGSAGPVLSTGSASPMLGHFYGYMPRAAFRPRPTTTIPVKEQSGYARSRTGDEGFDPFVVCIRHTHMIAPIPSPLLPGRSKPSDHLPTGGPYPKNLLS